MGGYSMDNNAIKISIITFIHRLQAAMTRSCSFIASSTISNLPGSQFGSQETKASRKLFKYLKKVAIGSQVKLCPAFMECKVVRCGTMQINACIA
jgi:hypothetical protein